ncbi:hypothetical protein K466DRAFT_172131 [Polyporus arcularius HHB13444]|uniref:Uncharacterized protein n=1 Tax=Polyporus arcularius HHB13444 TaxID=1314778 RepID=A0A5C3P8B7_9APHY|nr:hypothetical protein K466DRAFT_172131 [Polyporus arcularius HHB13444]
MKWVQSDFGDWVEEFLPCSDPEKEAEDMEILEFKPFEIDMSSETAMHRGLADMFNNYLTVIGRRKFVVRRPVDARSASPSAALNARRPTGPLTSRPVGRPRAAAGSPYPSGCPFPTNPTTPGSAGVPTATAFSTSPCTHCARRKALGAESGPPPNIDGEKTFLVKLQAPHGVPQQALMIYDVASRSDRCSSGGKTLLLCTTTASPRSPARGSRLEGGRCTSGRSGRGTSS